jgi:hypothetical protein
MLSLSAEIPLLQFNILGRYGRNILGINLTARDPN